MKEPEESGAHEEAVDKAKDARDGAGSEDALVPVAAVGARVSDGGCLPEAWTLRLLPRAVPELGMTTVLGGASLTLLMFVVGGSPYSPVALLATGLFLLAAWAAVVLPTETAVRDLAGQRAGPPARRLADLAGDLARSLPLALVQAALLGYLLAVGGPLLRRALGPGPAYLAVMLGFFWVPAASCLTVVRRRLLSESWLTSVAAGHLQVARFFPLALVDVYRDWRFRRRFDLGAFPGVPGQGTVHARLGVAAGLAIAGFLVAFSLVSSLASVADLHGAAGYLLAVAVGSGGALGTALGATTLAHAYAGWLSLREGHLDAWLEGGAPREALPAGTDDPPPAPGDDLPSGAGSAAG